MTLGGWITFLASFLFFLGLFVWCVWKVFATRNVRDDDLHGAFDIYEIERDSKRRR